VFTSNRGEETVGIFTHGKDSQLSKVKVGGRPNGLAFNPREDRLLAANVSKPDDKGPITVSIINVTASRMVANIPVPGRTRWAIYDRTADVFYVNISDPPEIAILNGKNPDRVVDSYKIPAIGPHGLDLDEMGRRLFCACDKEGLYTIDIESRRVSKMADLAGPPDVIFYNPNLDHLYVAVGDPGIIQVFDTNVVKQIESVKTEKGTHTIAFDQETDKVYAFMPETHSASVYLDE
jgi:DNA-binding beta-propeller fold protein YncE